MVTVNQKVGARANFCSVPGAGRCCQAERTQDIASCDIPQSDDEPQPRQGAQTRREKWTTACLFNGQGLVPRRRATYGVGDHAIDQSKAVLRGRAIRPLRKAEPCQCGKEELSGIIARKRSAGAVGPASPRSQSDHEEPGARVAEGWCGAVEPIGVRCAILGAVIHQAGAERAVALRFGDVHEPRH